MSENPENKKAESPRLECFHNRKIFIVICFTASLSNSFELTNTTNMVFSNKALFRKL